MKKVLLSLSLVAAAIAFFGWRGLSDNPPQESSPAAVNPAPRDLGAKRSRNREHGSISLPGSQSRRPGSQPSTGDATTALAPWWVNYSESERALYQLRLIEQDPFQEIYQVSFRGFPIQHLNIRRELKNSQRIDPLPVFSPLDESDLIAVDDGIQTIKNRLGEFAGGYEFRGRVWSLGGGQTLIPSYVYYVTNRETDSGETWTINAKNGEVLGRNTHSRR